MRRSHVVGVALGGLLAAAFGAGCSAEPEPPDPARLDTASRMACTDFAKGHRAGVNTRAARLDLASKVNKQAAASQTVRVVEAGQVLAKAANSGAEAWAVGADTFAAACLGAGFTSADVT